VAGRRSGHALKDVLSVGLEVDVLDRDAVKREARLICPTRSFS